MPLKFDVHALRSNISLLYEYELDILPNEKDITAKHHGKNYMKDGPPLVRHLLSNGLLPFVAFKNR